MLSKYIHSILIDCLRVVTILFISPGHFRRIGMKIESNKLLAQMTGFDALKLRTGKYSSLCLKVFQSEKKFGREMMANQILYNGPEGEISMPANTFGNVSTQVRNGIGYCCQPSLSDIKL
jgi:hypothetical protein